MGISLFVFICALSYVHGEVSNLHSVLVVFRHGTRTPSKFSPKDTNQDPKYWNQLAPGELTNRGKEEHFRLGKWLRDRYHGFLPIAYHKHDIYVRSSDTDRCLMSAAANLAGLYPPTKDLMWGEENIQWSPIPIHSVPAEDDSLLKMGRACPNFKPKYEEILKSANVTEMDKSNADLYKYLTENLGETIDSLTDIESPYDALSVEAQFNLRLPPWTEKVLNGKKVFPDQMKILADYSFHLPTYTEELARLSTGRFFDTLATQFQATIKNDTEKMLAKKMVMLSAHKSTIADITHTLGNIKLAPFAGALIFELRRHPDTNKFYVNTLFKSGNVAEQMEVGGCHENCAYNQFREIIKPYRLSKEQWKSACFSGVSRNVISLTTVLSLVLAFILNKFFL